MIAIEIPKVPGEDRVDADRVPTAITNAIAVLRQTRPDLETTGSRPFDRYFEQQHKCRVEYWDPAKAVPKRIIWPDDRDYTIFALRWGSL